MAEYALAQGAEVFGSSRWRSKSENIDHLRARITLIESDLRLHPQRGPAYSRAAPRRPYGAIGHPLHQRDPAIQGEGIPGRPDAGRWRRGLGHAASSGVRMG